MSAITNSGVSLKIVDNSNRSRFISKSGLYIYSIGDTVVIESDGRTILKEPFNEITAPVGANVNEKVDAIGAFLA